MSVDAGILTPVIPLVSFGASVVAIYDAVLSSDPHRDGAGLRKLPWLLIMALLGPIGAALYRFRARTRLEKINARS